MKVSDFLRVPYLVTAQSVPRDDGSWVRHVEHPELPQCTAEAESITEALQRLDQRRIEVVLEMLAQGRTPPHRRYRLGPTEALYRVERAGLLDRVQPVWNEDVAGVAS